MANPIRPNTYADGEAIDALRFNEDFDAIYNWAKNEAMHRDGSVQFGVFPSAPGNGALPTQPQQLANKLYVDKVGGLWETYTPTFSGINLGGANNLRGGRFVTIGNTVMMNAYFQIGTDGFASSTDYIEVSLPTKARYSPSAFHQVGSAVILDQSAQRWYPASTLLVNGGEDVRIIHPESGRSGFASQGGPMNWSTGDQCSLNLFYEKA